MKINNFFPFSESLFGVKLAVDVSKLQAKSVYIAHYPSRFSKMNQYVFKNMLCSKHCIIQHDKYIYYNLFP